jgi:hypothetical protein
VGVGFRLGLSQNRGRLTRRRRVAEAQRKKGNFDSNRIIRMRAGDENKCREGMTTRNAAQRKGEKSFWISSWWHLAALA